MRSVGKLKTMLRARQISTVPRLGARCPPLVPTVFMMISRISWARWGNLSRGIFLRSAGELMESSRRVIYEHSQQTHFTLAMESIIVGIWGKCKGGREKGRIPFMIATYANNPISPFPNRFWKYAASRPLICERGHWHGEDQIRFVAGSGEGGNNHFFCNTGDTSVLFMVRRTTQDGHEWKTTRS